ncbi:unnamed protein product [Mytilus edulis]|uniref:Uncharacterized protein n=1 Tax=Mytilus edulis TaxID=6550 RepID=A0A8S3UX17_MYTED|nr:unnamed protein product [Mytilus edulis]
MSTVIATTNDSSEAAENTTVESVTTSRDVPRAKSDTSITNDTSGTNILATGLVVGLVICGLLLACAVIVIVVLIRRRTFKSRPIEKIRNTLGGSQDIAVPLITANHSRLMQDDGKNSHTAFAVRRNKILSDNQALNNDYYSTVDQTAEQRFNETKDDGTRTTDSYMALDPSVTGFNRNLSNTPSVYEFAKPVGDTENNIGDEDRYGFTAEGVYDHSGSNRHEESENNIYNNSVDTIYDSGSHKINDETREDGDEDQYVLSDERVYDHSRIISHNESEDNNCNNAVDTIYDSGSHKINDEKRENTYDHFFGQKTEDQYDISTRT